jgi:malonyl-CoA/methylmalonyl-CoA synthetase
MYRRLAEYGEACPDERRKLSRARLLVSGSAPLPVRERERLLRLFGQRGVERDGPTETLIDTAQRHDGPRQPGAVGPPLPGVELRLVDDARRPLDAGGLGEVAVKGPNVFVGYLGCPEATARPWRRVVHTETSPPWARTGRSDVGRAHGPHQDRRARWSGESSGALEHPAVREAAVIGCPMTTSAMDRRLRRAGRRQRVPGELPSTWPAPRAAQGRARRTSSRHCPATPWQGAEEGAGGAVPFRR